MTAKPGSRPRGSWLRLATWPFRHIRWKIVLPYAFLTVVLASAGSYLVTNLVTGSLEERFDNQLAEAGRVVSDAVVRQERVHLESVRAVAFTSGVPEAVEARDARALRDLAGPIAANDKVERLEVLDATGARVKTFELVDREQLVHQDILDDDVPASWPIVQQVLGGDADSRGDKFAQIIQTGKGFYLYTAGPISDASGKLVGVALVGTSLETFLLNTKAAALADITVYDFQGNALVSTFARPEDTTSDEANLDISGDALEQSIGAAGTVREHRTLWGRGYDLFYGRLQVRNQAVGLYSVGLPTDFIFTAGSNTRTQVAVLFGVGMAAALGIGLYLAHRLTEPILRLVKTARLVTAGDLSARTGVRSQDEIGTLAESFDEMTLKLQRQHLATIKALTSAIDARDPYTLGHSVRVGQLAVTIGRHLGLDDRTLGQLEVGGYLHDIGKIGIRDSILLKPSSLTPEERHIIEEHPRIGLAILDPVDLPDEVVAFVASHHERLDGSGYPQGLTGEDVPLIARIAAVADMYDAVTTDRPYRGPMSLEEALALLRSEAGTMLDPEVVEALAAIQDEWESRRSSETELQGFKLPGIDLEEVPV